MPSPKNFLIRTTAGAAAVATALLGLMVASPAHARENVGKLPTCTYGSCRYGFGADEARLRTFTVPDGVEEVDLVVSGAAGSFGGFGGVVRTQVDVEPGEILSFAVGERGERATDVYGGGTSGAGGGTFAYRGEGPDAELLAVAGGGGGAYHSDEGEAGDGGGWAGVETRGLAGGDGTGEGSGKGGQVDAPGSGGRVGEEGAGGDGTGPAGAPGTFGQGGIPGGKRNSLTDWGGGGGYYGGGGGRGHIDSGFDHAAGGGGSGYLAPGLPLLEPELSAVNTGDGHVRVSWKAEHPALKLVGPGNLFDAEVAAPGDVVPLHLTAPAELLADGMPVEVTVSRSTTTYVRESAVVHAAAQGSTTGILEITAPKAQGKVDVRVEYAGDGKYGRGSASTQLLVGLPLDPILLVDGEPLGDEPVTSRRIDVLVEDQEPGTTLRVWHLHEIVASGVVAEDRTFRQSFELGDHEYTGPTQVSVDLFLTGSKRQTGVATFTVDHLTTATAVRVPQEVRPGSPVTLELERTGTQLGQATRGASGDQLRVELRDGKARLLVDGTPVDVADLGLPGDELGDARVLPVTFTAPTTVGDHEVTVEFDEDVRSLGVTSTTAFAVVADAPLEGGTLSEVTSSGEAAGDTDTTVGGGLAVTGSEPGWLILLAGLLLGAGVALRRFVLQQAQARHAR